MGFLHQFKDHPKIDVHVIECTDSTQLVGLYVNFGWNIHYHPVPLHIHLVRGDVGTL